MRLPLPCAFPGPEDEAADELVRREAVANVTAKALIRPGGVESPLLRPTPRRAATATATARRVWWRTAGDVEAAVADVERAVLRHFARLWVLEAIAAAGPPRLLSCNLSRHTIVTQEAAAAVAAAVDGRVLALIVTRGFAPLGAESCHWRRLFSDTREQAAYVRLLPAAVRRWLLLYVNPHARAAAASYAEEEELDAKLETNAEKMSPKFATAMTDQQQEAAMSAVVVATTMFAAECQAGLSRVLALLCYRARRRRAVLCSEGGKQASPSDWDTTAAAEVEARPVMEEDRGLHVPAGGLGLAFLAVGPLAEFAAAAGGPAAAAAAAAAVELANGLALAALLARDDAVRERLLAASAVSLVAVPAGGLRAGPALRALAMAASGAAAQMVMREAPYLALGARYSADARRCAALVAAVRRADELPDDTAPPRWEAACLDPSMPQTAVGIFALGDKARDLALTTLSGTHRRTYRSNFSSQMGIHIDHTLGHKLAHEISRSRW